MTTITVLPPVDNGLHFDEYAHKRRVNAIKVTSGAPERARIVEEKDASEFASNGLSFQDYSSNMHTQRRSTKPWPRRGYTQPTWPADDEAVQEVVCRYLERRLYMPLGTGMSYDERIAKINATVTWRSKYTETLLDSQLDKHEAGSVCSKEVQNTDSRLVLERRNLPALVTAVIYYKYRLGYTSPQISQETGIKPPAVRILLYRLNIVYRDWQTGRPRSRRNAFTGLPRKSKVSARKWGWTKNEIILLWFLRNSGLTWVKCGQALGRVKGSNVGNLVGVYKHHFGKHVPFKEYGWTKTKLQKLKALRGTGKTWKECGQAFGITGAAVYNTYERHLGKA